jgi:hypothetical protein
MSDACKNCGTPMVGKYCHNCGQKVIHPHERKLWHLIFEYFHAFTHLDGKYTKTLINVLVRPGLITREVSSHITVPHFKLTSLFLVGVIIYFLLPAGFIVNTPMNGDFQKQISQGEFSSWKNKMADNKVAADRIGKQELQARYDHRLQDFGKLLSLLMIPLVIPVVWLTCLLVKLFRKDFNFTAYDVGLASVEINSLILYGLFIIGGLILKILGWISNNEILVFIGFIIILLATLFMLLKFFRRAYQLKWWQGAICLAIFFIGYTYMLSIYSLLSFSILI